MPIQSMITAYIGVFCVNTWVTDECVQCRVKCDNPSPWTSVFPAGYFQECLLVSCFLTIILCMTIQAMSGKVAIQICSVDLVVVVHSVNH